MTCLVRGGVTRLVLASSFALWALLSTCREVFEAKARYFASFYGAAYRPRAAPPLTAA